jgi:hypothetical protein
MGEGLEKVVELPHGSWQSFKANLTGGLGELFALTWLAQQKVPEGEVCARGKEAGPVFERKYEEEFWVYPTLVASSTRQELESIASEYERLKSDYNSLSSSYSALWSECERLRGQAVQNTILLAALVILVAAFIAVAGYALHLEREIRRIRAGAAR